jgi:SAM-dependent methyltransferase
VIVRTADKLRALLEIYRIVPRLPGWKLAAWTLINPMDSTRYVEFACLLRFLNERGIGPGKILDVSSPYVLAYVLSRFGNVVKTDINPREGKRIRGDGNLSFRLEDATHLSFPDDTFDLVCSISVIEHIYEGYLAAVREMVRVTRPGGYVYLSFPVSSRRDEEWRGEDPYGRQHGRKGKWFFQYRFSEDDLANICSVSGEVEVLDRSVYWERKEGRYDRVMRLLLKDCGIEKANLLKYSLVNLWSGWFLLDNRPEGFQASKPFGNASVLFRKRVGTTPGGSD